VDAGVAALLGAGIGFGGSAVLDIFRERKQNQRWVRNEKRRVYSSLLGALGEALKYAKLAGEIGVPRVELWEIAKHLGELRLFGEQATAQQLNDLFVASIWEAGEFIHYTSLIEFNDTVTEVARKDLGI